MEWLDVSRSERDKGARGEREVAAIFRAVGFDCDRVPNSGGLRIKGDLYGNVPAHIESKNQRVLRMPLWIAQTQDQSPAGVLPLLAFKLDARDHARIAGWHGSAPLEQLAALMAVAATASVKS